MTLLIVTPWPLSSPGGAERLTLGLASSLAGEFGIDVVVAAGSGLCDDAPPPVASTTIREVRLPLVSATDGARRHAWMWCPHPSDLQLRGLEELGTALRPQAVLYASHYSSCAEQAAKLAKRLGAPFAFLPAIHLDVRRHTTCGVQRFCAAADLLLGLSEAECEWLTGRAAVTPDRVVLLGCGWSGPVKPTRAPRSPQDPLRLLSVSAYARHKQLDHQLEAVALLRRAHGLDVRLTIAGALREPPLLDRLRRLASRLGIEEAVQFLADRDDATIAAAHASSHLFLFTSRSESFGVALLDAVGHGTWPVVYPHPIYRGLVEASQFGGVARYATPSALADAVVAALTDIPGAREDARRQWLERHSWRAIAGPFARWTLRLESA